MAPDKEDVRMGIKDPKLIVVGAGKWGRNLIKTAYSMGVLVAIVDTNLEAIDEVVKSLKLPETVGRHAQLAVAMEQNANAAVVIATPPTTHYSVAHKAISAGRDVFVEKPLCDSLERAEELVGVAKKMEVILMVDHLLQYAVHHRRLLQLVKSGFVGEVTRVKMMRMNFGTVRTEENVLWSLTPHDVSVLIGICGMPERVVCCGQKVVSCGIEDYVDVNLGFEDGVQANIECSWMHPLKERRVVVYGTSGALVLNEDVPDKNAKKLVGFKWSAKRKSDGSAVVIEKQEEDLIRHLNEPEANGEEKAPLQAALEHFVECLKERKVPRTDGNEGVNVVRVLAAATKSLRMDGAVVQLAVGADKSRVAVHSTAVVDDGAKIGAGTKIWHFSHIMGGARVGPSCNIGQNVYIGGKAILGRNVKVQNNVSIYDAVTIADDVFLGPSCVMTNVKTPRSHVNRKHAFTETTIGKGATIGANATIVCGVRLGQYCFIGAGAVVTKDVPPHGMVYGNPATLQGWVSTIGTKLIQVAGIGDGTKILHCPESKEVYTFHEKGLNGSSEPCVVKTEDKR